MLTLGAVLLVVAGGLTADIIVESKGATEVSIAGHGVSLADWRLFVFGMIVGAIVMVGLWMVVAGQTRDRRRRRLERQERRGATSIESHTGPRPAVTPVPSAAEPEESQTRPTDQVVASKTRPRQRAAATGGQAPRS